MARPEIYLSTDIETDGPIPGPHSMLSFASAAYTSGKELLDTFSANLVTLPGATGDPDTMAWWATQPRAWAACRTDQQDPADAMARYRDWLESLPGRPVFVGYPAAFDFMFVYWCLATIRGYLSNYRLTLGMKCEDLTPEQLAARSVPPSTMSLLGLIRHMARVENNWFYRVLQGHREVPRLYWTVEEHDLDFDGAVPDAGVVEDAFRVWREQIVAADHWLDSLVDLGAVVSMGGGEEASVRDILVHMVEEYARHCGHADLLRECIDGRTGQ